MNKDTTAMQDLISFVSEYFSTEYEILEKAEELIFKEREQILNAYNQGYRDAEVDNEPNDDVSYYDDAEQYYNQTYNN